MQVTCPACSTRYTTDDAKVRGKTVRMRCRACDTVWLVQGPPKDEARRAAKSAAPFAAPSGAFGSEDVETGRFDAHRESLDARTEKRAAVVKRGTEREQRDLFASQLPDEGFVKQTLRPPPFGVGVGARSEDSVLFTVDSLRAAAKLQTPPPAVYVSASPAVSDDEGVIDLNALAPRPAPYAVSPLGLGSEPPIGFAREVSGTSGFPSQVPAQRHARGPWIAAGASVAAMAVAAVAAVALFGGTIPHRATRSSVHVAAAAASAGNRAHEIAAKQEADRKATEKLAADKAEAEKEALATKKGGKGAKGGRYVASSSARVPASAPAARPAPKPAGDACGCKGDFTCILRCSAKGK